MSEKASIQYRKELENSQIHFRDLWQFELKSEFISDPQLEYYSQEFYFFIPESLQVNEQNYTREQFYQDETNLIRFKTPTFTLKELEDLNYPTPLARLKFLEETPESKKLIEDEIKLFGNVLRSSIRQEMIQLIESFENPYCDDSRFKGEILQFYRQIDHIMENFKTIKEDFKAKEADPSILIHFEYVEKFIKNALNYYAVGLLNTLRREKRWRENFHEEDEKLCECLYRHRIKNAPRLKEGFDEDEEILYEQGLINKFVLDALLLEINRLSPYKRMKHWIGALSAGIAMLFYLVLTIWQGSVFLINSVPFVILTVILYVLKDRIKDGFKILASRGLFRFVPDYTISIYTPTHDRIIGKLFETFNFLKTDKLPQDIIRARNWESHEFLEFYERPESVIFYKKKVKMYHRGNGEEKRLYDLNNFFRLNLRNFLSKASNPYQTYLSLDFDTHKIIQTELPKVYHLNIILKNSYLLKDKAVREEIQRYKIIVDKNGIKRVESIPSL